MAPASRAQPGLGHLRSILEEPSGPETHPPCGEEVNGCIEAGSPQRHLQDLEIQLHAPTPPPEVPEVHARVTATPVTHHKGQDTMEGLIPETKLLRELGQPANVDKTPQNVTASAPPPPQQPEEQDVMVVPIVQDLPFLDKAVKRQLERHIVKMKIQRHYGLPTKDLEYGKNLEDIGLGQKAHQPPSPQRRTVLPYRSPFRHWGRHARRRKPVGHLPALKDESEDHEQERGPGTQGDVHSPSPSGQAEWAQPQSKGAPQGQSD